MGLFDKFISRKGDDEEQGDYELVSRNQNTEEHLVNLGVIEDFARDVAPTALLNKDNYIKVGQEFSRTLYAYQYPPDLEIGWMTPLTRLSESIDFALHIVPVPVENFLDVLRDKIGKDGARMREIDEKGNQPDYDIEQRYQDNTALAELIERRETKPFQVALVVTVRAQTREDLDQLTEILERQIMKPANTRRPDDRHHDGFVSTLPALQNNIADNFSLRLVHTLGLLAFFPLTASELSHETGVLLGRNRLTNSNVIVNRFDTNEVTNHNMAIFGSSGSGKSYFAKAEMLQWSLLGFPIVIIDPQAEYQKLCNELGGQFISMDFATNKYINPLDFSHAIDPRSRMDPDIAEQQGNVLAQKIDNVISLISVMMQGGMGQSGFELNIYQQTLLQRALDRLYKSFGYSTQSFKSQVSATSDVMPTLSDLYSLLERISKQKPDDQTYQENIKNLLIGLSQYVGDGNYARLFDNYTNVTMNSNFVVFNVKNVSDRMRPVVMQLVLEYLRTQIYSFQQQTTGHHRLLYIDESHRLMDFKQTSDFIALATREARKFGVGITIINQDTNKFLLSADGQSPNPSGQSILNNCSMRMLMKQEASNIDVVQEAFKLNREEALLLTNSSKGEGLLYVERERAWVSMFNMMPSEIHSILTSEIG